MLDWGECRVAAGLMVTVAEPNAWSSNPSQVLPTSTKCPLVVPIALFTSALTRPLYCDDSPGRRVLLCLDRV